MSSKIFISTEASTHQHHFHNHVFKSSCTVYLECCRRRQQFLCTLCILRVIFVYLQPNLQHPETLAIFQHFGLTHTMPFHRPLTTAEIHVPILSVLFFFYTSCTYRETTHKINNHDMLTTSYCNNVHWEFLTWSSLNNVSAQRKTNHVRCILLAKKRNSKNLQKDDQKQPNL